MTYIPSSAWLDEQDAVGDMLDDRDGDHDGFGAHWDARIAAEETSCTRTNNRSVPT